MSFNIGFALDKGTVDPVTGEKSRRLRMNIKRTGSTSLYGPVPTQPLDAVTGAVPIVPNAADPGGSAIPSPAEQARLTHNSTVTTTDIGGRPVTTVAHPSFVPRKTTAKKTASASSAMPEGIYAGTGMIGEPFFTNNPLEYSNPKASKTGWKRIASDSGVLPATTGAVPGAESVMPSVDAGGSTLSFMDHRAAVDAIMRAYNQPSVANLRAGALAQRFLETQGNLQNEEARIKAATGLTGAQIRNITAQAAHMNAETGAMPGSFGEASRAKIAEEAAAHPKSDFGIAAAALARVLLESNKKQSEKVSDYDKMLAVLRKHMGGSGPTDEYGYSENTAQGVQSPYPDGTRLTVPGGKTYVVRNGQPVPETVAEVAMPKMGEIRKGYRYIGGDPSSPQSWEKLTGGEQPPIEGAQ